MERWKRVFFGLGCLGLASCGNLSKPQVDDRARTLAREVGDKGWIAFGARSEHGDWDLFLMRPDGSAIRNITETPDYSEAAPRFSPDGTKLLYRRLPRQATISHDRWGFQGKLIVANSDGTEAAVYGQDGEYPWASWSPDGTELCCLSLKGILIVDFKSRTVVRSLSRKGIYQQLFWSPDGKWLLGVSNHLGEDWTIAKMEFQTGEISAIHSFRNCTPDWFPDSRRVVFSNRPGNQEGYGFTQLWMADIDGQNAGLIYGQDGHHVYGGTISPDSRYVLFTIGPSDGGASESNGAPMALMRLADAPTVEGESLALREIYPNAKNGPILSLPTGWEPDWTYREIGGGG